MPPSALARITEPIPFIASDELIDKRSGRPKRIPKKIRNAIRLIEDGEVTTVKAAAARVGLDRTHLSRSLGMPHVQAFLARRSRETIGAGVVRAAARAVELIDAKSEHVSADTSFRVLAINGIAPAQGQVSVNIDIKAGYVLDLREPAHVAHERGNEAKLLIEHKVVSDISGE